LECSHAKRGEGANKIKLKMRYSSLANNLYFFDSFLEFLYSSNEYFSEGTGLEKKVEKVVYSFDSCCPFSLLWIKLKNDGNEQGDNANDS
jgi:hypothetical protein